MRYLVRDLITQEWIGETDDHEQAERLAEGYNLACSDQLAAEIVDREDDLEGPR